MTEWEEPDDDLRAIGSKAFAAQKACDYDTAIIHWLALVGREPRWAFGYPYFNLANCYVRQNRIDEAEAAYKKAVDVSPTDQMFTDGLQSLSDAKSAGAFHRRHKG